MTPITKKICKNILSNNVLSKSTTHPHRQYPCYESKINLEDNSRLARTNDRARVEVETGVRRRRSANGDAGGNSTTILDLVGDDVGGGGDGGDDH